MSDKIAMMGFGGVVLFPVIKNDIKGYQVGEGIPIPWAQEMTKDSDTSENKIYADDSIYLNLKSWNGLNVNLTVAQMPLKYFEILGFGSFDEVTNTLKWNPQGQNKEFAMGFRCLRADGKYRMYKMFSFTVNELKEADMKTKGDDVAISSYEIIGTFTQRACDGLVSEIKDGDDLSWLDNIEEMAGEVIG